MFDKLITLNYRRGGGGEFFCHLIDSSFKHYEFDQDTSYGTENRFEYVGIDIIFRTYLHHYFWCVFADYRDIDEYINAEFGYPWGGEGISLRKAYKSEKVDRLIKIWDMHIHDAEKEYQIENLKQYCIDTVSKVYDTYFAENDVPYAISNLHYNNCNKYNLPIGYFLEGSKNINLINTVVDEYFKTLLWIYKRMPDLKRYQSLNGKKSVIMSKQDLINYYMFEKKKEYHVFPGELGIEAFDLFHRGLNIDDQLSDLLGTKVNLDYARVKAYGEKNRQLLIDHFDFDVFKDYSQEYVEQKFIEHVDRIYDSI